MQPEKSKICTCCKQEKPYSEFSFRKGHKDRLYPRVYCKTCAALKKKEKYQNDPETRKKALEANKNWMKENADKRKKYEQKYKEENKEKIKDRKKIAILSGVCSYYCAIRRARKKEATPCWADKEEIKNIYMEAKYFQMEVDHIIPLQHKLVCGLHVPANLQLLYPVENASKSNKFVIE